MSVSGSSSFWVASLRLRRLEFWVGLWASGGFRTVPWLTLLRFKERVMLKTWWFCKFVESWRLAERERERESSCLVFDVQTWLYVWRYLQKGFFLIRQLSHQNFSLHDKCSWYWYELSPRRLRMCGSFNLRVPSLISLQFWVGSIKVFLLLLFLGRQVSVCWCCRSWRVRRKRAEGLEQHHHLGWCSWTLKLSRYKEARVN